MDEAGNSELWQHKGGAIDNVNNWAEIGNKRLTELSYTLYNVNQRTNNASTYFTLETAIAAIPTTDRFPAMAITFRSGSSSNPGNSFAVYLISSVPDDNFLNVSNWIVWTDRITQHESDIAQLKDDFKKTSDFYNVNQRTNTLTTFYTLETAIAAIPETDRKALMWITFRTGAASNQKNSFAQYTGGNTADENFLDTKKWIVWTDRITQNESDIAQLKGGAITTDVLEGIKSNMEYDYTNEVSFDTSYLIDNADTPTKVSLEGTHYNDLYAGVKIPCKAGDMFLIAGRSGKARVRLYVFADAEGNILEVSYGITIEPKKGEGFKGAKIFEVPENCAYLIFNPDTRADYLCVRLKSYLKEIRQVRWLALGDSITDGTTSRYTNEQQSETATETNATYSYAYTVARLNNVLYDNKGLGGMGYLCNSTNGTYPYNARTLIDHITTPGDVLYVDLTQVDIVTIALGINDYKSNYELGEVTDNISLGTTVCSNMKYLISKIAGVNPNVKIIVITPMNARGYGYTLGDESTNYAMNFANTKGKTLKDFMETIIAVCENYGIQYINQTTQSVVNRYNIVEALPDGVHPTIEIQKMIGRELSRNITYL